MRLPLLLFLLISHRYQRNIHLCAIFGPFSTRDEAQKEKMEFALIQVSEESFNQFEFCLKPLYYSSLKSLLDTYDVTFSVICQLQESVDLLWWIRSNSGSVPDLWNWPWIRNSFPVPLSFLACLIKAATWRSIARPELLHDSTYVYVILNDAYNALCLLSNMDLHNSNE